MAYTEIENNLWETRLTFKEMYPSLTSFKKYIDIITEVVYTFDIEETYNALVRNYYFDKIKAPSKLGFEYDFSKIWNENIHLWNRVFDLLSVDYSEETGSQQVTTEVVKDVVNDVIESINSGTAKQDTFEKPQFAAIESNISSRINGENDDTQNREQDRIQDINKDVTTKSQLINKNEQIEEYLSKYRRFSYTELVSNFERLYLNLLS